MPKEHLGCCLGQRVAGMSLSWEWFRPDVPLQSRSKQSSKNIFHLVMSGCGSAILHTKPSCNCYDLLCRHSLPERYCPDRLGRVNSLEVRVQWHFVWAFQSLPPICVKRCRLSNWRFDLEKRVPSESFEASGTINIVNVSSGEKVSKRHTSQDTPKRVFCSIWSASSKPTRICTAPFE